MSSKTHPIFLLGCTAVGKGEAGRLLAERLQAEIVSLDSMKVYRGMNVGTAKPSVQSRRRVRYHLIDIVNPDEHFTTGNYLAHVETALRAIAELGKAPLFVGGTALYYKRLTSGLAVAPGTPSAIRAALKEEAAKKGTKALHAELAAIDPEAARRIHANDLKRISRALEVFRVTSRRFSDFLRETPPPMFSPGAYAAFCLRRSRDDLYTRINRRVDMMFDAGLVAEVRALLDKPGGLGPTASQALGYKEVIAMLNEGSPESETREFVKQKTRNFAKRQMTWFRSFDELAWIDVAPDAPASEIAGMIFRRL